MRFPLGRKKAAAPVTAGSSAGTPPRASLLGRLRGLGGRLSGKWRRGGARRPPPPQPATPPPATRQPARRRLGGAFLVAVAACVLLVAGTVAWLAMEAPQTLARRARLTALPDMTLTLPDGTPRIAAAPRPAPADPTAKPVTLAPSRNDALVERTANGGYLPHAAESGPQPWQAYARPFPQDDPRPRIALVIADMGWSSSMLDMVLGRLPGAVTLAFAPGAPNLQAAVDKARADGHEALMEVPLEPLGYPRDDPGPGTLLTTLSDEKNTTRLESAMSAATGYVGLTSMTGSKFLTDPAAVRSLLEQVHQRGLIYVDSWLTAGSLATRTATALKVPRAVSDVQVDRVPTANGIEAQLAELERLAKANGVAVGFARPYPVTVEEIARWFLTLHDKGIVLAPVTAVVNRQTDR